MSDNPIIYKRHREQKIYIFTAGGDAPSDISRLPEYSIACIGFNCHAKSVSPANFDHRWMKVGESGGSRSSESLDIAVRMFDKKIAELNEAMRMQNEQYGPGTNVHTSMSNANNLLNHLRSRIDQRIQDMKTHSRTIFLAEPEFYMHPHIYIEAEIGVVFYHSTVSDPEYFQRAYWTNMFKEYTERNSFFTRAFDIHEHPNANAIDIIYPERYDNNKQKLCEYEKLYGISDGAIAESNRAIKAIQQREQERAELREQAAEEEARRLRFNEEVKKMNKEREKQDAERAETAAIEAAVASQAKPWNRIKNTVASFFPITMSMGGKSNRSKRSKRSKQSKRVNRVKRSNRSKRVKRN